MGEMNIKNNPFYKLIGLVITAIAMQLRIILSILNIFYIWLTTYIVRFPYKQQASIQMKQSFLQMRIVF